MKKVYIKSKKFPKIQVARCMRGSPETHVFFRVQITFSWCRCTRTVVEMRIVHMKEWRRRTVSPILHFSMTPCAVATCCTPLLTGYGEMPH